MRNQYLAISAPDTKATVNILDINASVEIEVDRKARTIRVVLKAAEDETASEWKQEEITLALP